MQHVVTDVSPSRNPVAQPTQHTPCHSQPAPPCQQECTGNGYPSSQVLLISSCFVDGAKNPTDQTQPEQHPTERQGMGRQCTPRNRPVAQELPPYPSQRHKQ
mmetsp:Transcript_87266/g.173215  ORF Transcript_87266/g.173215 Transcript_87266/m.173215 type:complete len:102 (+) Transcript_87266:655-960(+)